MVVSKPNGEVLFVEAAPEGTSISPPGTVIHTSGTGKYVPAATCRGYVAVADRDLIVYRKGTPSGWVEHVRFTSGGTRPLFEMQRRSRSLEWYCPAADSFEQPRIVASSGGIHESVRNETYRPRIYVFVCTTDMTSCQRDNPYLHVDDWIVSFEDSLQASGDSIWTTSSTALLSQAYPPGNTGPYAHFYPSGFERLAVYKNFVATTMGFYPEYGQENQLPGVPLLLFQLWDRSLVTTVGDRACTASTSMHTANYPLMLIQQSTSPYIFIGCPGSQSAASPVPHVEVWTRESTKGCNGLEDRLAQVTSLLPSGGDDVFPGFAALNTLSDNGNPSSGGSFEPADQDLQNVAPGIALVLGSESTVSGVDTFRVAIGDPGFDSTTTTDLDVGRVIVLSFTSQGSSGLSKSLEGTLTVDSATHGEMLGANRLAAASVASADVVAMPSFRSSPHKVRVGSNPRGSTQLYSTTVADDTDSGQRMAVGSSIAASGRWLATTDAGRVALYSDADSPHGFTASSVSETDIAKASFHSFVHTGLWPYHPDNFGTPSFPSKYFDTQFIGSPLVQFLPASVAYDGKPRLVVVGPTTSEPSDASVRPAAPRLWKVWVYEPALKATTSLPSSDPDAQLHVSTANATNIAWSVMAQMDLPSGYSACSHLYNACADSSANYCKSWEGAKCASRIEVLALPPAPSRSAPRDTALSAQLNALGNAEFPEPLSPDVAAGSTPHGLRRDAAGLKGCEDGVTLAVPDAGLVPGARLVCVRGHLRPFSSTPAQPNALALNSAPSPLNAEPDGHVSTGLACRDNSVTGCVFRAKRANGGNASNLVAGTRITSGFMLGDLWLGIINDQSHLELWRYDQHDERFETWTRRWSLQGLTLQEDVVNPIQASHEQDVVILSHLDTIVAGPEPDPNTATTPQSLKTYHFYADFATGSIRADEGTTLSTPAAINSIDSCGYGTFGTAIIGHHSLLAEEGLLGVMYTNGVGANDGCTTPSSMVASSPAHLVMFTVRPDPIRQAALLDNDHDYMADASIAAMQREADLFTSTIGIGNSASAATLPRPPRRTRPASFLLRNSDQHVLPTATSFDYLATYTLESADAYIPNKEEAANDGGGAFPEAVVGSSAVELRTNAWALVRTAESAYPWHLAGLYNSKPSAFTERRRVFGAGDDTADPMLDPVGVLRAGAGFPRLFMQAGSGIVQVDRTVVGVSHTSLGSNAKIGSLLAPLASLSVAVQQACTFSTEASALCAPVVLIGDGPTSSEAASYLPSTLATGSALPGWDGSTGQDLTGTVTYEAKRTNSRWASFNVTIHGAGVRRSRIVLHPPNSDGSGTDQTVFSVSSLTLKDVTIDGGRALDQYASPGVAAEVAGSGGVLAMVASTTGARPQLRLIRAAVFNGGANEAGGLISSAGGDVVAVDSLLASGESTSSGGGLVFLSTQATGTFVRTRMTHGNALSRSGGAIYAESSTVVLDQTWIDQCKAPTSGGALYASSTQTVVLRSEMSRNEASGSGGALDVSYGKAIVWLSTFASNEASDGDGGALLVSQSSGKPESTSWVGDSSFLGNAAAGSGGAVRVTTGGRLTTRRSGWAYNLAQSSGGGVSVSSSTASWSEGGSLLFANAAVVAGGAVHVDSLATATMLGTEVRKSASYAGGGVSCSARATLLANASSASGNPARFVETATELTARGYPSQEAAPSLVLDSNQAEATGGGGYLSSCVATLQKPLITSNELVFPDRLYTATSAVSGSSGAFGHTRTSPRGPGRVSDQAVSPYRDLAQASASSTTAAAARPDPPAMSAMLLAPATSGGWPSTETTSSTNARGDTAVFFTEPRLSAVPAGMQDGGLSNSSEAVGTGPGTPVTTADTAILDGAVAFGGGLYVDESSSTGNGQVVVAQARFVSNNAGDGSGGCLAAMASSSVRQCTTNPAYCFHNNVQPTTANYLSVVESVTMTGCIASRGPAVYWTAMPFQGVTAMAAQANGLVAIDPSVAGPGSSPDTTWVKAQISNSAWTYVNDGSSGFTTSDPIPAIETFLAQIQFVNGSGLAKEVEPGSTIGSAGTTTSSAGSFSVRMLDVYGSAGSPARDLSYSVSIAITSPLGGGQAVLSGTTSASYSNADGAVVFRDLALRANAGQQVEVTVSDSTSSSGIRSAVETISVATQCSGRAQLTGSPQTCEACPQNQYSDGGQLCKSCNPGEVLDTTTARGSCSPCASGSFENGGTCELCSAGRFSGSPSATSCELCSEGKFVNFNGATQCSDCGNGEESNSGRTGCNLCGSNQVSVGGQPGGCQSCGDGQRPNANVTTCEPCPEGFFGVGGASCSQCPAGRYAPGTGNVVCLDCDPGTVSIAPGAGSCSPCTENGQIPNSGRSLCVSCASPTAIAFPGNDTCTECPAGWVPLPSKAGCQQCAAGRAANPLAGTCDACASGQVAPAGSTTCTNCGVGLQANAIQSQCEQCPKGTFSAGDGACQECVAGRYQGLTGQSTCTDCDPGTFSTGAASQCTACTGNSIASSSGATACTSCGDAQVAQNGKTQCDACPAGQQVGLATDGSSVCVVCPAGHVSSTSGTTCSACDPGYIPNQQRTTCLACPSVGVTCDGSVMRTIDGYWWSAGALQTDVDADGQPWMYLPESTVMHECPSTTACNVTVNEILSAARALAAQSASLTTAQRASRVQQYLSAAVNGSALNPDFVACSLGYDGPRCALCSSGYSAVTGTGECVQCLDSGTNWLIVAAGLVVVIVVASFLVNNTYRANVKSKAGSNSTPALVRVVANFLKISATLGSFKTRAPEVIQAIRSGANTVSSGVPVDVGPVACAFSLNFERQLVGVVLLPLVIILVVSLVCGCMYMRAVYLPSCCRCCHRGASAVQGGDKGARPKEEDDDEVKEALASVSGGGSTQGSSRRSSIRPTDAALAEAAISRAAKEGRTVAPDERAVVRRKYLRFCQSAITILLFLIYSMLVKTVFTAWSLYSQPINGQVYLAADFAVTTTSAAYTRIVIIAVVGLIVWVLGIPAAAVLLLYRNRHRLLDDDFAVAFSFIYAGYNIGTARMVNAATIGQARSILDHLSSLTEADLERLRSKRALVPAGGSAPSTAKTGPQANAAPSPDAKDDEDDAEDDAGTAAARSTTAKAGATSPQPLTKTTTPTPPTTAPASNKMVSSPSFVRRQHHRASAHSRSTNIRLLETIVNEFEDTAVKHDNISWWFWEVVVLARLVLVTIVAVFVSDPFAQSYAALAIVIAALLAHLAAKPYADTVLNFAETVGLVTVLVTQLGSLLWSLGSASTLDDFAITVVLVVINILVLVVFAVLLVFSVLGESRLRRIPFCGRCIASAYFRERNLRQRYQTARRREDVLAMATSDDPKIRDLAAKHHLTNSQAAAAAAVAGVAVAAGAGVAAARSGVIASLTG